MRVHCGSNLAAPCGLANGGIGALLPMADDPAYGLKMPHTCRSRYPPGSAQLGLKTEGGVIEFVSDRNGLNSATFSRSLNAGLGPQLLCLAGAYQGATPRRKERQL
jgi:hypothetical protein